MPARPAEPPHRLFRLSGQRWLAVPVDVLVWRRVHQRRVDKRVEDLVFLGQRVQQAGLVTEDDLEVERPDVVTDDPLGRQEDPPHLFKIRGEVNLVLTPELVAAETKHLLGWQVVKLARLHGLYVKNDNLV